MLVSAVGRYRIDRVELISKLPRLPIKRENSYEIDIGARLPRSLVITLQRVAQRQA